MSRPKPRIDWSARTELPENPYGADDQNSIVKAIEGSKCSQLSEANRRLLLSWVWQVGRSYLLAKHQHLGPKPGEIKAALARLGKDAERLSQTINTLDDATIFALFRQHGEFRKAYLEVQGQSAKERCLQALSIISALVAEAEAAKKEVGKPNPPADENPLDWLIDWEFDPIYRSGPPVGRFIVQLAEIYHEITGEEPEFKHDRVEDTYSGAFFRFVDACLKPLEGQSRAALGRTIQDYLPIWREARRLKT